MIADLDPAWRWDILGPLLRTAFAPIPTTPLPLWAGQNVFLDRKVTTKPGFYDPDEFGWTWEFQEIIRTRAVGTYAHPHDGAICLCDAAAVPPGGTIRSVERVAVMKSSVSGFTEGFLNGVRWIAQNDPQNVAFAIDSAKEAGDINEIRLQPTLRRLGEEIFSDEDDDAKRFLLNLRRMLVYFLGSYSEAAFANKMAELACGDELEEHGDPKSVENLESRLKSAARPLLMLLSKPKLAGGRIDGEYNRGTMCVYEIPCPHCGAYQQLLQDAMKFDHWRTMFGDWDFSHAQDPHFECVNPQCKKPIEESWKRWFNDRSRRRWRITNPNPEPGHVSFHISDFYGYHPDARWRKLAVKYISSKGDPLARQSYRNHHEGLPWEVRATKTEVEDILALRGEYTRGILPWKPDAIILGGDVGQNYATGTIVAFRRKNNGEAAVIDFFDVTHPKHILALRAKRYHCPEDGKDYAIKIGFVDAKYEKDQVNKACYQSGAWLWPAAGISADLSARSISMNHVTGFPEWFKAMVFADRDAKTELYVHRITDWVEWLRTGQHLALDDPARHEPEIGRLWFPADLRKDDDALLQHTTERLVEVTAKDKGWMPHAAKQFVWKRKGPNHKGDGTKIALRAWRWFTIDQTEGLPTRPLTPADPRSVEQPGSSSGS